MIFTSNGNQLNDIMLGAKVPRKPKGGIRAPQATTLGRLSFLGASSNSPNIDLSLVQRVYNIEGLFKAAVGKYMTKFTKEGFSLTGKNIDAINYIRQRFELMEEVGGCSLNKLLDAMGRSLFVYGNSFVYRSNNEDASGGSRYTDILGNVKLPIAGYFNLDPAYMYPDLNENGVILKWIYGPPQTKETTFAPQTIIHTAYDKLPGSVYGIPLIWQAISDISALRKIEENIELLIHNHAIPIYKITVGDDQFFPHVDAADLDDAANSLSNMVINGAIALPWYQDADVIDSKSNLGTITEAVNHFKNRIYATLGVSPLDMGEGDTANKSTASTVSSTFIDTVKYFQKLITDEINAEIRRMLYEGKWDDVYGDNAVYLKANEIDIDNKIKVEEHALTMYQGNLETREEVRASIGMDPLKPEEEDGMFLHKVTIPTTIAQGVVTSETTPKTNAEGAPVGNPSTKDMIRVVKEAIGNSPTKQKLTPRNQYGKKTGPGSQNNSISEFRKIFNSGNKTEIINKLNLFITDENILKSVSEMIDTYLQTDKEVTENIEKEAILEYIFSELLNIESETDSEQTNDLTDNNET